MLAFARLGAVTNTVAHVVAVVAGDLDFRDLSGLLGAVLGNVTEFLNAVSIYHINKT